jgi:hypothetical protein
MYQREFCGLCPFASRRSAVIKKPWGQNRKKASNVSRLVIGLRASCRGHAASVSSVYKTVTCTTAALNPTVSDLHAVGNLVWNYGSLSASSLTW